MAKDATTSTTAKPRRAPRTPEQQLADLQAKVDARRDRDREKATGQLEKVTAQIEALAPKLSKLYERQRQLHQLLGLSTETFESTSED